jgi:stage II sporulation protein D
VPRRRNAAVAPTIAITLLLALGASAGAQPLVRVLLLETTGTVLVEIDGPHRGAVDARSFATALGLSWPVGAHGDDVVVDGRAVGALLELAADAGELRVDGRRYRGALRLLASAGRLLVINVVDLEHYLQGVVPAEMQASWPLEALKAQAVAARTYVLANLHPAGAYDVCATSDCQVYRGADAEHPRSDRAVAETSGLVLTFGGTFARTYYHADSGGVIASAGEVWGTPLPYLQAFRDVVADGPHRRWDHHLDPLVVARSLATGGYAVGEVRRVRVTAFSESGRAARLEIVGDAGTVVLTGAPLRHQARAWGLRSTRFQMAGDLVARGEGWGHGVGMSQYGARQLALSGHTFTQILGFYYPQTALQRVNPLAAR